MKTLIISDIHSNFEALKAMVQGVEHDRLVCLGDIVSFGPQPVECLDFIIEHADVVISGNHEKSIISKRGMEIDNELPQHKMWEIWTAQQLNDFHIDYLLKLPDMKKIRLDGDLILLTHNIAGDSYLYPESNDKAFEDFAEECSESMIFFSHSHVPFARNINNCHFYNTGSIGQARIGYPAATAIMIDAGEIRFIETSYNYEKNIRALQCLPLHPEYIKLWGKFYRKGMVERNELDILEKHLRKKVALYEELEK